MKIGVVMRKVNSAEFTHTAMKLCHAYGTINTMGPKNLTLWVCKDGDAEMCRETLEETGAKFIRYYYMKVE